jgi:hypothetical protein
MVPMKINSDRRGSRFPYLYFEPQVEDITTNKKYRTTADLGITKLIPQVPVGQESHAVLDEIKQFATLLKISSAVVVQTIGVETDMSGYWWLRSRIDSQA